MEGMDLFLWTTPPTQDASHKWRFGSGFPILKIKSSSWWHWVGGVYKSKLLLQRLESVSWPNGLELEVNDWLVANKNGASFSVAKNVYAI